MNPLFIVVDPLIADVTAYNTTTLFLHEALESLVGVYLACKDDRETPFNLILPDNNNEILVESFGDSFTDFAMKHLIKEDLSGIGDFVHGDLEGILCYTVYHVDKFSEIPIVSREFIRKVIYFYMLSYVEFLPAGSEYFRLKEEVRKSYLEDLRRKK